MSDQPKPMAGYTCTCNREKRGALQHSSHCLVANLSAQIKPEPKPTTGEWALVAAAIVDPSGKQFVIWADTEDETFRHQILKAHDLLVTALARVGGVMSENPKPTTGEWTLMPCALHFNIVCGDTVIYEGVTSEMQGNHLCNAHNAALAAERDNVRHRAERMQSLVSDNLALQNEIQKLRKQLAAAQAANQRLKSLCHDVRSAVESAVHDRLKQSWLLKFKEIEELTDTTALDAAITAANQDCDDRWDSYCKDKVAAAQKPLVDALKKVRHRSRHDGVMCEIIDAALAKVKEDNET